jgi:hypothetical protein
MCYRYVVDLRRLLFAEVMEYKSSPLWGPPVPMICWSKAVSGESYPVGQLDQIDLPSIN